ncbi:hypothetical protein [Paractinoplanes atraurantiacus]|uniref:Uncharacterized protein n=1 Tax=Paractinoplanes atraurantiacus TaxID=1036182 RepID=A0A285GN81_9ACTN|nr:hypothetical protein [Actinoplanes atraurantiacus]SNY25017.1 hypothetical protein SAMN05421748_102271 [Actinoplanes atraurantiacus]
MTRSLTAVAAATAMTTALLAVPTAAQAAPGGIKTRYTSTQTSVRFTSGTGLIRAWQDCESSSGQTIFRQYGSWRTINNWSTAGPCSTRIIKRGWQTANAS